MSRAKSEPDYDFGPYEDEYRGFEIRDDETGRGPLILVLALGVLLIFAGVVWNTYRQGVRTTEGGLPVIVSDSDSFKRSPDDRGGVEVAGQDKAYYGSMDGLGDPALQKTSARNPLDIRRRTPETLAGGPAELPPIEGADEAPKIVYAEAAEEESIETELETPIQIAMAKPVRETAIDATIQESSPSELSVSRFVAAGTYQVQLSALRSEDAAQSAWKSLQNTAPDLYAGAELDIQRADLGAKGVFYRLRIGSFADRDAAKGFCADVKATGKDCMVVAKAIG
jgi:cell division septation protein DedD